MVCRTSYQRQGLLTEAVQGITGFAASALGLRRSMSRPDVDNWPSRQVAERAGYALEGVMRHERKAPDGTLRNTCLYALVR
jgi:RimJ/RimL family protein N-acetyltransferase